MNRSINASYMKFWAVIGISLGLAFLTQLILPPTLSASMWPTGGTGINSATVFLTPETSALDANGLRHRGIEYGRNGRSWLQDVIKAVTPDYPYSDRILHHDGIGLFQISLDLKAGSVSRVTVLKSTGFPSLDTSVASALRQWRWKPGKWKEIEITVGFTTAMAGRLAPPGSIRLASTRAP